MMKPATALDGSGQLILVLHKVRTGGDRAVLQWRRIAKGRPQIIRHLILRREIDLFKQFGRDGETAGCFDLPKSRVAVHILVELVGAVDTLSGCFVGLKIRHDDVMMMMMMRGGSNCVGGAKGTGNGKGVEFVVSHR